MKALAASLLLAVPLLATAGDIWRCGPEGRSYSAEPCAGGRRVAPADTPSATQLLEARGLAVHERRLAETLRRERLQREAVPAGAGLAGIGAARPGAGPLRPARAAAARSGVRHRLGGLPAGEETWRATAPPIRRTKG